MITIHQKSQRCAFTMEANLNRNSPQYHCESIDPLEQSTHSVDEQNEYDFTFFILDRPEPSMFAPIA